MAQTYLPFPTSLNSSEALLIQAVLQDCIPCNVMCMAPHAVPRHSQYTHTHTLGSNIYVTITTRMEQTSTPHMDSFRALVEDTSRLLMKGALLPAGHYPVSESDTFNSVGTASSSSGQAASDGDSGGVSAENTATTAVPSALPHFPSGVALTDVESMYSKDM